MIFFISIVINVIAKTNANPSAVGPACRTPSIPQIIGIMINDGIKNIICLDNDKIADFIGFPIDCKNILDEICTPCNTVNIKSAKKRILVIETKTLRNKMVKSKVKTLTKKVEAAVAAADKNAAATALKNAVVAIDKAAAKGIFHKNTAARKVSRLSKAVNKMA